MTDFAVQLRGETTFPALVPVLRVNSLYNVWDPQALFWIHHTVDARLAPVRSVLLLDDPLPAARYRQTIATVPARPAAPAFRFEPTVLPVKKLKKTHSAALVYRQFISDIDVVDE